MKNATKTTTRRNKNAHRGPATCACETPELWVTCGTVNCKECGTFLPGHPDSDPRPGLVEANQWR